MRIASLSSFVGFHGFFCPFGAPLSVFLTFSTSSDATKLLKSSEAVLFATENSF
jgi:hypothetical protein